MPIDRKLLESCSTEALVKDCLELWEANAKLLDTPEYVPHHEVALTFVCKQISAVCILYANLYDELEQVHIAAVAAHKQLGEYSAERDQAIVALLERVTALEARLAQH